MIRINAIDQNNKYTDRNLNSDKIFISLQKPNKLLKFYCPKGNQYMNL